MNPQKYIPRFDFNGSLKAEYDEYMSEFKSALNRARDKKVAFAEFRHKLDADFKNDQRIYPKIDQALLEIERRVALDKSISFEQALEESKPYIEMGGNMFGVLLSSYMAKQRLFDFLHKHPLNRSDQFDEHSSDQVKNETLVWGSTFSQRDFLKLIYALKEVGYLKGEITRMVPYIATALNYPLSKEWQTNFSKGLHKNNLDFKQGKIFDVLKSAFEDYAANQIANQLKRTNKKN